MTRRLLSFVVSIAAAALLALPGAAVPQSASEQRAPECREWHACRQLALDALARGEYEQFHDLAWRTIQTGPPRDPALMYLLARAQSLSGRPHDALVMLDRLAEMGVATDAATNDDFRPVRTLRDWPALDTKIRALGKAPTEASESAGPAKPGAELPKLPVAPASAAPVAAPDAQPAAASPSPEASTPAEAEPASPIARHPAEDAVRVPDVAFRPKGLAYDAVSSRFIVADLASRKLVIFDERSHRAIDLVRASSAGFDDITAFEIDPRRGDLWVLSAGAASGATLHKLQLVSGRPLGRFEVPASFDPVQFDDVAVTPGGTVLMLDAKGRRILGFDPAAHRFSVAATLLIDEARSLAPADDRTVYVAYGDGILHVDLSARTATPLPHAADATLGGFTRIRWVGSALIGVQAHADGRFGIVEVTLGNHRARVAPIADASIDDPTSVTFSGHDLYVLNRTNPVAGEAEIVVQRIRLK